MATDKEVQIEKVVNLDGDDLIKGDPGRAWIAPQKPVPATTPTDTTPKPNGITNSGNDNPSKDKS